MFFTMSLIENGKIGAAESYSLTYPYLDVEADIQKDLTDIIEQNFLFQEIIEIHSTQSNCAFDALSYSLRMIRESYGVHLNKRKFVDCMGNGGIAAVFASSYGFNNLLSIEYCEDSHSVALSILNDIHGQGIRCNISLSVGSLQDYFQFDSDVMYFDCTFCTIDSMIDEGCLLDVLFRLSKGLQAGSFLIVCTYGTTLTSDDLVSLGHSHLMCMNHSEVKYHSVVRNDLNDGIDSLDLWILKTVVVNKHK